MHSRNEMNFSRVEKKQTMVSGRLYTISSDCLNLEFSVFIKLNLVLVTGKTLNSLLYFHILGMTFIFSFSVCSEESILLWVLLEFLHLQRAADLHLRVSYYTWLWATLGLGNFFLICSKTLLPAFTPSISLQHSPLGLQPLLKSLRGTYMSEGHSRTTSCWQKLQNCLCKEIKYAKLVLWGPDNGLLGLMVSPLKE